MTAADPLLAWPTSSQGRAHHAGAEPEPPAGHSGWPPGLLIRLEGACRQRCQTCHGEELRGPPDSHVVDVTKRLATAIKRTASRARPDAGSAWDRELTGLDRVSSDPAAANANAVTRCRSRGARRARSAETHRPGALLSGPVYAPEDWPRVGRAAVSTSAYDLNKVRLGRRLSERFRSSRHRIRNTGSGTPRGAVVTAGGLIFRERPTNAFRVRQDTGKQLWKEAFAEPDGVAATYQVAGRQYTVIAARLSGRRRRRAPAAGAARRYPRLRSRQQGSGASVFALSRSDPERSPGDSGALPSSD